MTTVEVLDAALGALADIQRRVRAAGAEVAAAEADTRWQAAAVSGYRRAAAAAEQRLAQLAAQVAAVEDDVRAMRAQAALMGAG
jgi:hypothetical protein